MSKITFRADDDLVGRLESLDGSKSEIMREALRSYLDERQERTRHAGTRERQSARETVDEPSLDELIAGRVDAVIEQQLHRQPAREAQGRDVNVNVTLDQGERDVHTEADRQRENRRERHRNAADLSKRQSRLCSQCGEAVAGDHVYCPNCGEKNANRAFCECGDEIRPDWAYCPHCGRRTPSAGVLDRP